MVIYLSVHPSNVSRPERTNYRTDPVIPVLTRKWTHFAQLSLNGGSAALRLKHNRLAERLTCREHDKWNSSYCALFPFVQRVIFTLLLSFFFFLKRGQSFFVGPEKLPKGGSLVGMLCCVHINYFSDSPWVQHLPNPWWPAWQKSFFIHMLVPIQALVTEGKTSRKHLLVLR